MHYMIALIQSYVINPIGKKRHKLYPSYNTKTCYALKESPVAGLILALRNDAPVGG